MKTFEEAVDEYHGLANEAEALLSDGPLPGAEMLHQSIELLGSALATIQDYNGRLEAIVGVAQGRISQKPATPLPSTQVPDEAERPANRNP